MCDLNYSTVYGYLSKDMLGQIAYRYRYDYRIVRRANRGRQRGQRVDSYGSFTVYLSAVQRGYA